MTTRTTMRTRQGQGPGPGPVEFLEENHPPAEIGPPTNQRVKPRSMQDAREDTERFKTLKRSTKKSSGPPRSERRKVQRAKRDTAGQTER